MWILIVNLFLRYTNCIIYKNDRRVRLDWTWKRNRLTWVLIAPKNKRFIRIYTRKIGLEKYHER